MFYARHSPQPYGRILRERGGGVSEVDVGDLAVGVMARKVPVGDLQLRGVPVVKMDFETR